MDPYEAATRTYAASESLGDHRLHEAVTAALCAERKRTLGYWLCRLRQKVIWFGGWEEPNCGGFRFRSADPTPVSVCQVFTHYGWGWQLRLPTTFLVKSPTGVYLSPNGTPSRATHWLTKKPEWM